MEYEEVLFFVLGVRHYGALEEDFVARMSPCRVFHKVQQPKHDLVKLPREVYDLLFVLKITNPYTPKGLHFLVFTWIKILF
jgi:hypothetical protein